jgi:hypothetical protein
MRHPQSPGEGDDPATELLASADQEYFRAVEELFVSLRGAPMLLSPVDWQIARSWRRRGIPLAVLREALEGVFTRRRERGTTSRVNSLRYCAAAVEKAWRAQLELGRAAGPEQGASPALASPLAVGELLERLARDLPDSLPEVERWRARLRSLEGDADRVEQALAGLDAELLGELERALPGEERTQLRGAARSAAAKLAQRLASRDIDPVVDRLVAARLREKWGIQVLSLFAPAIDETENRP